MQHHVTTETCNSSEQHLLYVMLHNCRIRIDGIYGQAITCLYVSVYEVTEPVYISHRTFHTGGGPYAAACASILTNDPKYSRVRPAIKGLVLIASMTHTCGPDSAQLLAGMDMGNRIGYNMINFLPTITKHAIHVGAAAFKYMAMPTSRILMPRSFRSDTNKPLARCENLKQEHEEGLQTSQFNSSVRIGTPSWLKRMAFKMATTGMPQSDRCVTVMLSASTCIPHVDRPPVLKQLQLSYINTVAFVESRSNPLQPWNGLSICLHAFHDWHCVACMFPCASVVCTCVISISGLNDECISSVQRHPHPSR